MNQDTKFRGSDPYRIDAKGRISVPPKWRAELGKEFAMMKSSFGGMPAMKVLPMETVVAKSMEIRNDTTLEPGVAEDLIGAMNSRITDGSLNDQGKLLVPKATAEGFLELTMPGPVQVIGRGNHFLIMNAEHLAEAEAAQEKSVAEANARYRLF